MSPSDIRICFVGDSFINGTGDRTFLGWTGRVCQDAVNKGHEITYYNLGVRRETSVQITQRWEREVEARLPVDCDRRLVFSFGTNDTTLEGDIPRVSVTEASCQVKAMLTVAKPRYRVLMVGPPPVADSDQCDRIAHWSNLTEAVCQRLEVPYLDVFTPLSTSQVWMKGVRSGDGAHPDAAGYTELAQLVMSWPAWENWFRDRLHS